MGIPPEVREKKFIAKTPLPVGRRCAPRQSPWKLEVQDHSLIAARASDEDPYAALADYLNVSRPGGFLQPIGERQRRRASNKQASTH